MLVTSLLQVRHWCPTLLVACGLLCGGPLRAEPAPGETRQLGTPEDRLTLDEYYRFRDLALGERPVLDLAAAETTLNRAILAKAARWHIYRLTWPKCHEGSEGTTMNDVVREALRLVPGTDPRVPAKEEQEGYRQELGAQYLRCLAEVLRDQRPIVRVNAIRILAALPVLGNAAVRDQLTALVTDPAENAAVQLYALRGLKNWFARAQPAEPAPAVVAGNAAAVQAVLAFCTRAPLLSAEAPQDEVDGYRYVRREALRALVQGRAVLAPGSPQDRAVLTALVQASRADGGYAPPPSLSEQVEAALGLCGLEPDHYRPEDIDGLAQQVGLVVVEVGRQYVRQQQGLTVDQLPWKLTAVRLQVALRELSWRMRQTPLAARLGALTREANLLLTVIERVQAVPDVARVERWLESNPPQGVSALLSSAAPPP